MAGPDCLGATAKALPVTKVTALWGETCEHSKRQQARFQNGKRNGVSALLVQQHRRCRLVAT